MSLDKDRVIALIKQKRDVSPANSFAIVAIDGLNGELFLNAQSVTEIDEGYQALCNDRNYEVQGIVFLGNDRSIEDQLASYPMISRNLAWAEWNKAQAPLKQRSAPGRRF